MSLKNMPLCHYGYQTYLSTQPISNMSLKNMALCHYGYQTYLSTQPISNMSLKNMALCHYGLTLSTPYMSFCLAFCIFICMKKLQDINGLKKNHYLCIRISFPKK